MPFPAQDVKELLVNAIPHAEVQVFDMTGTQDHYKVIVVSDEFNGKSLVQRHQMVNEALKEPLKGPIHALTIEAHTKAQWHDKGGVSEPSQAPGPMPQGIKL